MRDCAPGKTDPERLTDASSRHGTDQDDGTGSIAPHHVLGSFSSAVERALHVDSHELAEPVARVLGCDKVLCFAGPGGESV
jgi:hypothetical protein